MAQADPGNLNALSTADNRIVAVLVEINWAKDAVDLTDPSSGTWVDESTWVEEMSGSDSGLPPGDSIIRPGPKPPATAAVKVANPDNPTAIVPVIPRFAARRTDSPLYANIGNGAYTHTPIRLWTGFMEFTPAALGVTLQGGGMNGSQKTFVVSAAGTITKGMVVRWDSELCAVTQVSGSTCYCQRGYRDTAAVTHAAGITAYRAGGLTVEFTGAIDDLQEDPAGGSVVISCIDRSLLFGKNKQSSPLYQNLTEAQVIANYLTLVTGAASALPIPSGQQKVDPGLFISPFAHLYNESIYDQCGMVASACGGKFRMNKEGYAVYENILALYGKASTWTYTAAELENVKPRNDTKAIYSDVRVFYSPRYKGAFQIVFEAARRIPVPAGGTLTRTFDLNYPASGVTQPVSVALHNTHKHDVNDTRDLVAVAGNVDITDSVTITAYTVYAQRIDVTFSNAHATLAADIVRFRVWGYPVLGGPQENVHVTRTTTPANLPPQELAIGEGGSEKYNWYRMEEIPATAIANFVADQVCRTRGRFPIRNARHSPQLEIFDLNTLTWAKPFTGSPTGFVLSKTWRITALQTLAPLAQMDVDILENAGIYPTANAFVVGTDQLSNGKVFI